MKLENYHEMLGTLEKYEENADNLKLHFVFKRSIELPKNALSTENLEEYKQQKIGIFHLDGEYYLRKTKPIK